MMEDDPNASFISAESTDCHESSTSHHIVLIAGHNKWEWIFILMSLLSVSLLMTSSILSNRHCLIDSSVKDQMQMLSCIVCFTSCVSLLFALYGMFKEHKYEIYMHSLLLLLSLLFNWIVYCVDPKCLFTLKLATNVSGCVMCICGFLLAFKATHVPDWVEFRIIGVSESLTNMYSQLCYFLAYLKADSLFMIIFALYSTQLTFVNEKLMDRSGWWIYQWEIIAYALLSWICGKLAVGFENMCLVKGFYFLNLIYSAIVIYQICIAFASDSNDVFRYTIIAFGFSMIFSKVYLIFQMLKSKQKFGNDLNSPSFKELVTRNSSSLLSRSRSALQF